MRPSPSPRASRAHSSALVALALASSALGCEEPPAPPAPVAPSGPTCAPASVVVPSAGGYPSSEVIERAVRAAVARDYHAEACLVRVEVLPDSLLVDASHEGRSIRARLAASRGTATESLAPHVAAHQQLQALREAHVESAISSGRAVALAFPDHGAICRRDVGQDAECVRTPSALGLDLVGHDSVREARPGVLVVRSPADPSAVLAVEWELTFGAESSLSTHRGRLSPAAPLGTPPPREERFARVHAAPAEPSTPTPEPAARAIAEAMPRGSTAIRFETRAVGLTRVVLLSRCEGAVAHCVSILATEDETHLRMAPSFASDPARMDLVDDASVLAPGALRVRIVEEGFHQASARDVFLIADGADMRAHLVPLGSETERGDEEVITEGCYRTLSIEGANRVRLSEARGWSGTRTDGRGWRVAASRTCAPDAELCLDPVSGFAPCP